MKTRWKEGLVWVIGTVIAGLMIAYTVMWVSDL